MVGGRDFYDSKFNRATQALRQPGSSFKPIVYAAAVQNGRPPSYILEDTAISVDQGTGTPWTPKNYDGRFEGPMPMRRGLFESRNMVAIQVGMELGENTIINEAITHLQKLQIITLEVFGNNTIAMNLYSKMGFIEFGRLPDGRLHRGQYVDDVYMYKRVRDS